MHSPWPVLTGTNHGLYTSRFGENRVARTDSVVCVASARLDLREGLQDMKAKERHRMHQNELSQWLAKWLPRLKVNSHASLLLMLLVVLGILAYVWWRQQSATQTSLAWDGFYMALSGGDAAKLEGVAALNPGTEVALWADVTAGDVHLANGCQQLFTDKTSAADALRKAVDRYVAVLRVSPGWRDAWDLIVRKFTAMPRLARWASAVLLLLCVVGLCSLPFWYGNQLARKRGTPGSGWKIGLVPFVVVVVVLIAACLGLPQVLHAMGVDTTPPYLLALHERATFGLGRAYEALAGTRQSQGELDKAMESYEAVVAKWPNGAYREMAERRLEALRQEETKSLYDKFAQFEPKPAQPDVPGLPGGRPPFDLDSLPEDGSLPGLPDSLMPGADDEPVTEGGAAPADADGGKSGPVDSAAPASEEPSGPEMPSAQEPAKPEETPARDQPKPEAAPADSAPAKQSPGQEPAAPEKPAPPGPTGKSDPSDAK